MPEERYSYLSAIGPDKVGILYEGSTAHLVFQQVRLSDISNYPVWKEKNPASG